MKINSRGYWENETAEGHGVDTNLVIGIRTFLDREAESHYYPELTLLDIGCGNGYYSHYLKMNSIYIEPTCYDGNPHTIEITKGKCEIMDFSKYQVLPIYDWVLSLEVGEHIPYEYEHIFIHNLVKHARFGIILSWATPGQNGDGHVNCKTNEYIREKIVKNGFKFDVNSTDFLRRMASPYPEVGYWFKNTLMVFRRF